MAYANQALLIVHVMFAMYWFGATSSVPRRLREGLAGDAVRAREVMAGFRRESKLFLASGTLVVLTGLAMALIRGFAFLPPRLHAGLGLSVIWLGLGIGMLRPTMMKIGQSLQGADSVPEAAHALRKRVTMVVGTQHLLFTVTTVLMLWRV